jgi:hypothetical protein
MTNRRLESFLPLLPLGVAAMAVWVAILAAAVHGSSWSTPPPGSPPHVVTTPWTPDPAAGQTPAPSD